MNQIKICRLIFGHPYTNRQIRQLGYKVIEAASICESALCRLHTIEYIETIRKEIVRAQITTEMLNQWINLEVRPVTKNRYNRRQAADLLGTTIETVRNWERNGLISSNKYGAMNEKVFSDSDMERLRIIYMLRQASYSMSSIHRSLVMYDGGYRNLVLPLLNEPANEEDLLSAGDRWLSTLNTLECDAMEILPLVDKMEKM